MNLVFMGTPALAVPILKALVDQGHNITTVITQPDRPTGRRQVITPPPVKLFALEQRLNIVQPSKLRTDEAREQLERLLAGQDAAVVAAYGRILPKWMLDAPRYGSINVHFSLLPKYRGAAPINWAIANGETVTGVTVMQMDEGLDTGPMLSQRAASIGPTETTPQLSERLSQLGAKMIVETLEMVDAGTVTSTAQNDKESTLAPILKREDARVDWSLSANEIFNRLRGFTPFPGCYTFHGEHRLEIVTALASEALDARLPGDRPCGTVVDISKDSISVLCARDSILVVSEVQPAGRRSMVVRDYLNGSNLRIGTRLE